MFNEDDTRHAGRWLLFEDVGDKFNVVELIDKDIIGRKWVWTKVNSETFLAAFHHKCTEIFL